ncbi:MAG TPA: DUF503 domain-containing protein [Candidatus Hypogeohydataceae bacterium YC41]
MAIGILSVKLVLRYSHSLKDKRRVLNSLKDRVRQDFNVSFSEMEALDHRQYCILAAAMISNDKRHVNGSLSTLVNFIKTFPQVELIDYELELL